MQLNRVFVAGRLTRDPDTRYISNERCCCHFSLAINRKYSKSDGQQCEEVCFLDVEAWGRTAELVGQYCQKGSECLVEGRLKTNTWEDKEGNRRTKIIAVADNVQFLRKPMNSDNDMSRAKPQETGIAAHVEQEQDEDVTF